jgi:glutamate--cysteine ligase
MPLYLDREELLEYLQAACVPEARRCVGLEWEKEAVDSHGRRLPFHGEGGIEALLSSLARDYGWSEQREGEHVIALDRGSEGENITLEPGGQIEYASPPRRRLVDIEIDVRRHLGELQDVTSGWDAQFLQTGFTPVQICADIDLVPKARYQLMDEYLGATGDLSRHMMRGTTSVQVSFDFNSPDDCANKFQAALGLTPVVTALLANSPLAEGAANGFLSYRTRCWQRTDPARTGLLDELVSRSPSIEGYLDWALGVPMMFYRCEGTMRNAGGRSFGEWMKAGIDGQHPDLDDFELHLTSLFPEVRLKKYIELRGADNGSLDRILAIAALWKGLLYDRFALGDARELAAELGVGDAPPTLLDVAASQGLQGNWNGRSLQLWAAELVDIAAEGLMHQDPDGPAEVAYLAPLQELVDSGRCPARDVLDVWEGHEVAAEAIAELAYPPLQDIPAVSPEAGLVSRSVADVRARRAGSPQPPTH